MTPGRIQESSHLSPLFRRLLLALEVLACLLVDDPHRVAPSAAIVDAKQLDLHLLASLTTSCVLFTRHLASCEMWLEATRKVRVRNIGCDKVIFLDAAGTRQVVWYFAEQYAADHARTLFAKNSLEKIIVKVQPAENP